jgi:hypothetical protein
MVIVCMHILAPHIVEQTHTRHSAFPHTTHYSRPHPHILVFIRLLVFKYIDAAFSATLIQPQLTSDQAHGDAGTDQ